MNVLRLSFVGMFVVTLIILGHVGNSLVGSVNAITGFAPADDYPDKAVFPGLCELSPSDPSYPGEDVCGTPGGYGGGTAGSNSGGSTTKVCSDRTSHGDCSNKNQGKFCSDGSLVDACEVCGCNSGDYCDSDTNQCFKANNCEEGLGLCLEQGDEFTCPENTNYVSEFDDSCNIGTSGGGSPILSKGGIKYAGTSPNGENNSGISSGRVCCVPNDQYWDESGGNDGEGYTTSESYDRLRQLLGICIDTSSRDSCSSSPGVYCNNDLNLEEDCTQCGCVQGFLCYQKSCVDPDEYDRLTFFDGVLELNPREKILVERPQERIHGISIEFAPGEFSPSFSPLYTGAQDVVPKLSPKRTPDNELIISGEVPDRDDDKFEVKIKVVQGIPKLNINFNAK